MFIPISLKMQRQLCTTGKIRISVSSGWEMISPTSSIPHNICYKKNLNNIHDDILLYMCYVTISTQTVTFSNLKKSTFIANSFYSNERTTYSLLKIVIEEITNWAKKTGRKHLIIISDLSHITEHFIDLGFLIEKRYKNFIGKKLLKGAR